MAEILTVFPDLRVTGGVQASGRLARATLGGTTLEVDASERRAAVVAALRVRRAPDVVLVWHMSLLKLVPFLRLPRRTRVVLFLHGIEAWSPRGYLSRLMLRRVDLFLSNTEYTWHRFAGAHPAYAAARRQTIWLGLNEPLEGLAPQPSGRRAALMLGRLVRSEDYKGHREMLAAWRYVRRQLPEAELWIAGDGDLRPQLERFTAAKGLGDAVRFFGHVSEDEKQQLIADSRCLALPSRAEGFGLVYLEAMRLGRPCLVSTLDAGREIVAPPQAGLAADPDQHEVLAGVVCDLLGGDSRWQEWSAAAQIRYVQHFTGRQFQDRLRAALVPRALSKGSFDDVWCRRRPAASSV